MALINTSQNTSFWIVVLFLRQISNMPLGWKRRRSSKEELEPKSIFPFLNLEILKVQLMSVDTYTNVNHHS